MDHIYQDQSGDLRKGYFYAFTVLDGVVEDYIVDMFDGGPGGVLARQTPSPEELRHRTGNTYFSVRLTEFVQFQQTMRSEKEIGLQRVADCLRGHLTGRYWKDLEVDLATGAHPSVLTRAELEMEFAMLVSWLFAEKLLHSGLRGYRFAPVIVHAERARLETSNLKVPDFVELQFTGRLCLRPMSIRGVPNACPHCGREPLICPDCGKEFSWCPNCQKSAWKTRDAKRDLGEKTLTVCPFEDRNRIIIEASTWDGSDFIFNGMNDLVPHLITKRALDWLLSVHAAPFYAHPVLVNVAGLTPEQLARVEAARRPV